MNPRHQMTPAEERFFEELTDRVVASLISYYKEVRKRTQDYERACDHCEDILLIPDPEQPNPKDFGLWDKTEIACADWLWECPDAFKGSLECELYGSELYNFMKELFYFYAEADGEEEGDY